MQLGPKKTVVRIESGGRISFFLGFAAFVLCFLVFLSWDASRLRLAPSLVQANAVLESTFLPGEVVLRTDAEATRDEIVSKEEIETLLDELTATEAIKSMWCAALNDPQENHKGLIQADSEPMPGALHRCITAKLVYKSSGNFRLFVNASSPQADFSRSLLNQWILAFVKQYDAVYAKNALGRLENVQQQAVDAYEHFLNENAEWRYHSAGVNKTIASFAIFSPSFDEAPTAVAATYTKKTHPDWAREQARLGQLEKQLAEVTQNKLPRHPEVIALNDAIEESRRRLSAVSRWLIEPTDTTKKTPAALNHSHPLSLLRHPREIAIEQAEIDAVILQLNIRLSKKAYIERNFALSDYKKILVSEKEAKTKAASTPNVLAAFSTTVLKDVPVSRQWIWIGVLACGILGIGIFLLNLGLRMRPVIATVGELTSQLSAPLIGIVPSYEPSLRPTVYREKQNILRYLLLGTAVLAILGVACLFFAVYYTAG